MMIGPIYYPLALGHVKIRLFDLPKLPFTRLDLVPRTPVFARNFYGKAFYPVIYTSLDLVSPLKCSR